MPATSHNIVAIPLQRAELYGRIGPEDDYATASTVDLVCTQITVEVNVIELGLITLAATTPGVGDDADRVEFDLAPQAVRRLARELLASADALDPDQ